MKFLRISRFSIILFLLFIIACEKEEWNNPLDPNSDASPDEWTPKNLITGQIDITKVKLTWEQKEKRIEGYKIDRKIGSSAWQNEYALIEKDTEEWIDTLAVPDSLNKYRLYAYAGDKNSSVIEKNITPLFPAPTNLQMLQISVKELKLTWKDNSSGEEGFKIDRKVGNGDWVIRYGVVESNTETWIDTSAVLDEINYYRLYAYVKSINSSKIEKNLNPSIPAPSNLQIRQLSDVEIKLTWKDNSNGEEGFKIDRKVGTNDWTDYYSTIEADITEWTDNAPVYGDVNYYRIYAYLGDKISSLIEINIEHTIQKPSNFSAESIDDQSIKLIWQDNCAYETGYRIERNNGSGFAQVAEVNADVTTYTDAGLSYGQSYLYRVRAFTDNNVSDYSSEISASTVFAAPSDLSANAIDDQSIELNWTDNCAYETGYRIERNNGSKFAQVGEVNVDVTTYTDAGLSYGQSYLYRVKAFTENNESDYSKEVQQDVIILPPSNLDFTIISEQSILLFWKDNCSYELGFQLERNDGTGFSEIGIINLNDTTFTDEGLNYGQSYLYRIKAFTNYNSSNYSDQIQTKIELLAPNNLLAEPYDGSSIRLTWADQNTFETGFKIECKVTGDFETEAVISSNITEYIQHRIVPGYTRTYRVLTFTDNFQSLFSNEDTSQAVSPGTVVDVDGNLYETIKIGTQWWMVENLKAKHYRNGEAITYVTSLSEWYQGTAGKYCAYDRDTDNLNKYGYLYNWYAINDYRKIAPEGWHVPDKEDWEILINYVGGYGIASKNLKSSSGWRIYSTGIDLYNFCALPGGMYNQYGFSGLE